jgi:bacterioferritin-associated ferredoxin
LDQFYSLRRNLELLEKAIFPFASRTPLHYRSPCIYEDLSVSMIVCSCNVISDHEVRHAVSAADELPRSAKQVYGCLGCSAECGRCARTIKTIIDEALGPCAEACQAGCRHDRADAAQDAFGPERFALAAA